MSAITAVFVDSAAGLSDYMWSALSIDAAAFEDVLAQWEEGEFAQLHPCVALPVAGLTTTIIFSAKKGEALQSQLIGMSE